MILFLAGIVATSGQAPQAAGEDRSEPTTPAKIEAAAKAEFQHESFTFVRIKYSGNGRRQMWRVDYPQADLNFSARLEKVTGLKNDIKHFWLG